MKIGNKLEEGLEGVTLFDEALKNVKKKLSDNLWYKDFCDKLKALKI